MSFDFSRLSDPGYFRENRMDAHSDHVAEGPEGASLRLSLNGAWYFFHARNEGQVIPGFEGPAYDCRGWEQIPVPAHIQMEGYGHPQYCNTQYPWDGTDGMEIGDDHDLLPESRGANEGAGRHVGLACFLTDGLILLRR